MMKRSALALMLGLLALSMMACSDSSELAEERDDSLPRLDAPQTPRQQSELRLDDGLLRDAWGRTVILRGVNARIEGVFDVTFDDGRTAVEEIPEFDADDIEQMRALGFNVLRLPINWSGVEPERGSLDEAYLQEVDRIVELCEQYKTYCLIDFHQDAYSKHIGEDGAPLWAIIPEPEELLEGPISSGELARRRTSDQVRKAFASFFTNADGIQQAFSTTFAAVAARYGQREAVVGFEIFNEPIVTDQITKLWDFYRRVITDTRAAGVDKPIFAEPNALRNISDAAPTPQQPFEDDQLVYAPHIYTTVFSPPGNHFASGDFEALVPSMERAAREADEFSKNGAGLFIGEYGIDPRAENANLWIRYQLDLQERTLAVGSAFWVWEEVSQHNWGVVQGDDGAPREGRARALARPYPTHVAGELTALSFEHDSQTLSFSYTPVSGGAVVAAPNVVYISPDYYFEPDALAVHCDGVLLDAEQIAFDADSGTVAFDCPIEGDELDAVADEPIAVRVTAGG